MTPKPTGPTRASLADLLEPLPHTTIDNLFTRFEVDALHPTPSKSRKTQHLVSEIASRGRDGEAFVEFVDYLSSRAFGNPTFARGSHAADDFYKQYDRDYGASQPASAAPQAPQERQFKRPGTTAPAPPPAPITTRRSVFIIQGRDSKVVAALVALLRALDLRVVTWQEATLLAGGGSDHTLDIVQAGIDNADAVIALFTPDDLGQVKREFWNERDGGVELQPSGQARQNVVFEAGWAMARKRDRVVLVNVGDVRGLSDIAGLNYVYLDGTLDSRKNLVAKLRNCKLEVRTDAEEWRTVGEFPSGA